MQTILDSKWSKHCQATIDKHIFTRNFLGMKHDMKIEYISLKENSSNLISATRNGPVTNESSQHDGNNSQESLTTDLFIDEG